MKRALICGISGQDGAYLARLLLKKGYEVWGTSRDAELSLFRNLSYLGIRGSIDSLIDKYHDYSINMLMKTDLQVFECQLLDRSKSAIKLAKAILIETSLISLYEDQKLYRYIIELIQNEGFMLLTPQSAFAEYKNVRTLQEDGLFFH